MTETLPYDDGDVVDLSQIPKRANRFRLYGTVYTFAPRVPVGRLGSLMDLQRGMGDGIRSGDLEPMFTVLGKVMAPDAVLELRQHADDIINPVDHTDILNALNYMLEVWGLRPPAESPGFTTTSGDVMSGTVSTDGAQPGE